MHPKLTIPLALVTILTAGCVEVQEGKDVTWELADGGLDGSQETDQTQLPGPGDATCRVRMVDDHNGIETVLGVDWLDDTHLVVSDGIDSAEPWQVEVWIEADGQLTIDAGVPQTSVDDLLENHPLVASGQLSFEFPEDHSCTDFEGALIYYLIMEWFYFG